MISKKYSETYLYSKNPVYEKKLFTTIMQADRIDKNDPRFDDLKYDVKKRQITEAIYKVLDSKNIVLLMPNDPLPKSFKVFTAKDVKETGHPLKTFIDCSGIVSIGKGGNYVSKDVDILISHIMSAMVSMIYYVKPQSLDSNNLRTIGTEAYAQLFTRIIDYICKISIMPEIKAKCMYMTSMFYQTNVLRLDNTDSTRALARKIAGISEREEDIIKIGVGIDTYSSLDKFIVNMVSTLRIHVTVDLVIEKWMFLYGNGTVFALEMFPAFSSMITDAYIGAYINNQKTITTVIGDNLTQFTKSIITIGGSV